MYYFIGTVGSGLNCLLFNLNHVLLFVNSFIKHIIALCKVSNHVCARAETPRMASCAMTKPWTSST